MAELPPEVRHPEDFSKDSKDSKEGLPEIIPTNLVKLVSEADRAKEYKDRAAVALASVTSLMDEALRDGLLIRFTNISINGYGRHDVVDLHVVKRY